MGILGRAKTMVRGWVAAPPPAAVPFNVACANGHRLRGHRTEGYQALRCPSCGEAVFVLPFSPLPEPPAPSAPKRPRPDREAEVAPFGDEAPHALSDPPAWPTATGPEPRDGASGATADADLPEIDWVDEVEPGPKTGPTSPPLVEPAPQPGRRPAPVVPSAPVRPNQPATKPKPRPVAASAPAPLPAPPRLTWGEWASSHRNALLAGAVIVVVVGAIAVRWRKQRLEGLPGIVEIGRTEGMRALDSGDFFAAKKILAEAAAAADGLNAHDEAATAIRQAAREAALLNDLVPSTLEDLVEEAAAFPDLGAWSAHFRGKYRGRSVVVETTITAAPDPSKSGSHFEDAYRIVTRGVAKPMEGRIGYEGFGLFESAPPKVGETKLFGARLASLEFDASEKVWVLALEPDSGAYITHTAALESLRWPAGEPVEEPTP